MEALNQENKKKRAEALLAQYQVMEKLARYKPIWIGTIPIGIDIEESDIDIACEVHDHPSFQREVRSLFGHLLAFKCRTIQENEEKRTVVTFDMI